MRRVPLALSMLALLTACGGRKPSPKRLPPPMPAVIGKTQKGVASWYGHPYHGRRTSNGEVYDMNKMTAAHRALPFDTWVQVMNLDNGRSTQVRINDRGPFVRGRIIDLSRAAAEAIAMIGPGTARVRLKIVKPPKRAPRSSARGASAGRSSTNRAAARRSVVQVGSFRQRSRAESVAAKVRRLGYKAELETAQANGAPVFRVLAAPQDGDSAETALRRLQREGFDGFVRPARD